MISPKEARLLALERLQARIGQIIRGTEDDLRAASQDWWDTAAAVAAGFGAPTPTPTPTPTTIFGTVDGCGSANVGAGTTVNIYDLTPTLLWTGTTNSSGQYSGTISITSPTPTTVTATPITARNTAGTTTGTVNVGTAFTYPTIICGAAAGYVCTMCTQATNQTVALVIGGASGAYPSDTLIYQSAPPVWALTVSGPGWLGQTLFTEGRDLANPNTYLYWLSTTQKLWSIRQNPAPQTFSDSVPYNGFNGHFLTCGAITAAPTIQYIKGGSTFLNAVVTM